MGHRVSERAEFRVRRFEFGGPLAHALGEHLIEGQNFLFVG